MKPQHKISGFAAYRTYWHATHYTGGYFGGGSTNMTRTPRKRGQLIGSLCELPTLDATLHSPVLDVDYPVQVVRKSAKQYVVTFEKAAGDQWACRNLLETLHRCGIMSAIALKRALAAVPNPVAPEEVVSLPPLTFRVPVLALPSFTKDHYHVFMDHLIGWEAYEDLLELMEETHIIESNFLSLSKEQKMSCVLKPELKQKPKPHVVDTLND